MFKLYDQAWTPTSNRANGFKHIDESLRGDHLMTGWLMRKWQSSDVAMKKVGDTRITLDMLQHTEADPQLDISSHPTLLNIISQAP